VASIATAPRWTRCPGSRVYPEPETRPDDPAGQALAVAMAVAHSRPPPGSADREVTEYGHRFGEALRERVGRAPLVVAAAVEPLPGVTGAVHAASIAGGLLTVYELAYGHRPVEVARNPALVLKALGLLPGLPQAPSAVQFHVYQPRAPHRQGVWRQWEMRAESLPAWRDLFVKTLAAPDTVLHSGPHCAGCPGRATCPALRGAAEAAIDCRMTGSPERLGNEAMGQELVILHEAVESLLNRQAALEAEALARIERGGFIPGWSAAPGRGKSRWTDPAQVGALGDLFGVTIRDPPGLATPAEARRRFKAAGLDDRVLDQYIIRPATAVRLERDTGSNPFDDDIPF